MISVTLTYIALVMRASNEGEGGIMASRPETTNVTADTLVLLYLIIVYGGIAVLSARAVVRQQLAGRGRPKPTDRRHRR